MLQATTTESESQTPKAQRYAVWMGALVTGFGTHGTPCWITQLSREDIRLTVAHPAVLSVKRLSPGRTVLVHLSHRTGETWQIIPLRAAVIGAEGNTFSARITSPTTHVVEDLLRALHGQGKAKELPGSAAVETSRASPPVSHAELAPARQIQRTAGDRSAVAQICCEVIEDFGAKWASKFLDRIDELLFAHISKEENRCLQRQLDECYLSFLMVRETLATEIPNQLSAVVNELFSQPLGQRGEVQSRGMGRSLKLIDTIDLNQSLAFNEAIDFLERTISAAKIIHLEERITGLLGEQIDEHSNPLRVDRVCVLALGISFEHWYAGESVKQIINDALRDSGSSLCAFYGALSAALDKVGLEPANPTA